MRQRHRRHNGQSGGRDLGPLGHTLTSVGIGSVIWASTGWPLAIPSAVAAGVLNDTDHVLDFYMYYVKNDRRRVFLLFHGWEFALGALAAAIAVGPHPLLLAAALGNLGHLVGDQIANKPVHPLAYSFVYRAYIRFDRERLFGEIPLTLSESLHKSIPLWGLIEPRLLKLTSRLGGMRR